MKKILITIILSLGFIFVNPVFAKPDIGLGMASKIAGQSGYDTADEYSLSKTIGGYIKGLLSLVGVIFLILTVYAGFLWMTASGEEEKITKAKNIIKSAIIGLIITLASYGITSFVVDRVKESSGVGSDPSAGDQNKWCCTFCAKSPPSAFTYSSFPQSNTASETKCRDSFNIWKDKQRGDTKFTSRNDGQCGC